MQRSCSRQSSGNRAVLWQKRCPAVARTASSISSASSQSLDICLRTSPVSQRGRRVCVGAEEQRPKTVSSRTDLDSDREDNDRKRTKVAVNATDDAPWHVQSFRDVDLALVFGDAWMVACSHFASSLVPASELTSFSTMAVGLWILVATVRGDYTSYRRISEEGSFLIGWTVYVGILQACFTWLFFTPAHLLLLSLLVSHGVIDPSPVIHIELGSKVSPLLEVDVAMLVTMTAWRAFYYMVHERLL